MAVNLAALSEMTLIKINLSCLLSSAFYSIASVGIGWWCPASIERKRTVPEECYSARAFSRAWAFWPQSTTCIGAQSICTSMKSFHAIKEEIKSESPLATFFPLPWLHHKRGEEQWRHWVVASSRLRCTAEMHSIIRRACRLWSDPLRMTHIVNIAFLAASR